LRIGIGYDVHSLQTGRKLVLGGVHIPFDRGLLGHSDADVLLHAICDALLGAAALGDIGQHFPNTDPAYKNIESLLIFLVGFGTLIDVPNKDIILTRGIGVRNTVDLGMYRDTIDKLWLLKVGGIELPLFMILVVLIFAGFVFYILRTRLGQEVKAIGSNTETSEVLGIDTRMIRIKVMILSTVLAAFGQLAYLQNIGMFDVYTAHLNTGIISCAALLAGGASIKSAKIRHALIGIFLFHTLFIVSPQAGQNLFNNAALGEYFRSFVAYGTIALALIFNVKHENK
jgi:simple sugar transport system permease protein